MRRSWRFTMAGIVGLTLTLLLPMGTNAAPAHYCLPNQPSYCIYEPQGSSGTGARGTSAIVSVPTSVTLYHTDELVVGTVFLYASSSFAIETGFGYGDDIVCGYNPHWTPYGTKNNGTTEQNNCTYYLTPASLYTFQSFVHNGTGFSFFDDQYGTPIWAVNWGSYNISGQNLDFTEVHGDGDWPSYGGTMSFYQEKWYDGNNWNYWGYTNVSNDCPYDATWGNNIYWYSYDAGYC